MSAKIIDGKAISFQIRERLHQQIISYQQDGHRPPCLAVILVGSDPASQVYVGHKKRACASVGIVSRSFELPQDTSQEELDSLLRQLNDDDAVDGILVQLPLPKHLSAERAIDLISPAKDVDGLTPFNQGMLVWRRPALRSCTPLGVMKMLESLDIPLQGKLAAVIGRSVLVGSPMAMMLGNAGATVMSLHSRTENPQALASQADILVVATGVYHLVNRKWVKPGAIVIDVGMHRLESGLAGDVDFDDVKDVASYITPVPGGVGPMTIAMLLSNCVEAYARRQGLPFQA